MTFFLEITLNLGRKLVLNNVILGLKIRISHRIFFQLVIYCMSDSLTTHKIPNFMTQFWHANCMNSLRGHRTPPIPITLRVRYILFFTPFLLLYCGALSWFIQQYTFFSRWLECIVLIWN